MPPSSLVLTIAIAVSIHCVTACDGNNAQPIDLPAPEVCDTPYAGGLCMPESFAQYDDDELGALANIIAEHIRDEFAAEQAIADGPAPACTDENMDDYLHAQRSMGRMSACLTIVDSCLQSGLAEPDDARLAFSGAQCAAALNLHERAYALFDRATRSAVSDAEDFAGRVLGFAYFAIATQYDDELDDILARHSPWNQDLQSTRAAVEYLWSGTLYTDTMSAVLRFIREGIEGADPALREQLAALYSAQQGRYQQHALLLFVYSNLDNIRLPLSSAHVEHGFVAGIYIAFFGEPTIGRDLAKRIYDAYVPYSSARSWLPIESNVHTYSELYALVCPDTLTRGDAASVYNTLLSDWRTGALSPADALSEADALLEQHGDQFADVRAFIGGIYQILGDDDSALDAYLYSHEMCPYYNRAHRGIATVRRTEFQHNLRDHDALMDDMRSIAENSGFSEPALQAFLVNASVLDGDIYDHIKYGISVWAPYIDFLLSGASTLYIKETFELLSQTPEREFLRDVRVDVLGDYRLYDDLRGVGGVPVVSERMETASVVFGTTNVPAHEVAHRFHAIAPDNLRVCITELYARAATLNAFTDPYAATNEQEYFAQGVMFYVIPEDAPLRYGLTRARVQEVDPALFSLIDTIARAETPLEDIACPETPPARVRPIHRIQATHGPRIHP